MSTVRAVGLRVLVKSGGEVADDAGILRSFCDDVALCLHAGIRMIVVHGGGKQASRLQERLGQRPVIVNGRRVTDAETLEVVTMAFAGKVNTDILLQLRRAGVDAVGISGIDAGLITAIRRPPQVVVDAESGESSSIDFGYVGDVVGVRTDLIEMLLDQEIVPVVASLGADDDGCAYNINADTLATSIAAAMKCDRLIFATDVDGIHDRAGKPLSELDSAACRYLIERKVIRGGMIPKTESALAALSGGVPHVQIINGLRHGSLRQALLSEAPTGTLIGSVPAPGRPDMVEPLSGPRMSSVDSGAGKAC